VKPLLVIGLGNPLVGDDGVGCRLVRRFARDPVFRQQAEFVVGGSDLLRLSHLLEGRERVVLIDAMMDEALEPGTVSVHDEPFDLLEDRWEHAHHPSAVQAVRLLKLTSPRLQKTAFTFIGVAVRELGHEAILMSRLPLIAAAVCDALITIRARGELNRSEEAAHR
jgi:hydrogenase maturation protease